MSVALSSKDVSPKSLGAVAGPRQPGRLTDSIVTLIVGRPERINWLRQFAPYTKVNKNPIDPAFTGWARQPKTPFKPTPFIHEPFTKRALEQWDAMPVLGRIYRPVTVPLSANGKRLKNQSLTTVLATGLKKAADGLPGTPIRVFYDGGHTHQALPALMPALEAAGSPVDLLDSEESYDLTKRLGDTGAASPFVGIVLAAMVGYTTGESSLVVPMRNPDEVTVIPVASPIPGKPGQGRPFGVELQPQVSSDY